MVVSPDGKIIVTAGEDGCIFVLGVKTDEISKETEEDEYLNNRQFIVDESLGDLLLMDREKIDNHFQ